MSKLQWFRLYSRMIDDDKLRLLAFEDRWHFVALCCLKSDGLLDEPDSEMRQRRIAVRMGIQARELEEIARRLREVSLIDEALNPIAWNELQYKSDNSTARVQAYREKKEKQASKKVKRSCNVSETVQEQSRTETEQNKRAGAHVNCPDEVEKDIWSDFLKVRDKQKAPVTKTALKGIQREADKAGWSLNDAIRESTERSWRGFKAEWVEKRQEQSQPAARSMSEAEWLAKCEAKVKWAREEGLTMVAREWEGKAAEVRARMGFKMPDLKVVS